MKCLCWGDPHLRIQGSFPPWNIPNKTGFTEEVFNTMKGRDFVCEKIIELKPDVVVFLGDLFHNMEKIRVSEVYLAWPFLQKIKNTCDSLGILHYGVAGNHDMASRDGQINIIDPLRGYFTEVFTTPTFKTKEGFLFLPYTDKFDYASSWVKEHGSKAEVLFTHLSFNGAVMESGKVDIGPTFNRYVPKVISGHIHMAQTVENVSYCGSLVQHRFYREDLSKIGGVYFYDTTTKEGVHYPNTKSKHYIIVKTIDDLMSLEDDNVVIQTRIEEDRETVSSICKDKNLEYQYILKLREGNDKSFYGEIPKVEPIEMLKGWVLKHRPEAMRILG